MEIAQRSDGDGATVVALDGEFDLATAPQVRDAVLGAVGGNGERVAVDMTACTFIDSTGLRILVEAGRKMQERGQKLALIGLRDQPLKIFELALGGRWEMFERTDAET
jgi:anti-sigma B factor antagonist